VRALLGQQVSVAAGRTFVARLVARAGATLPRPIHGLTRVFPAPGAVAAADLTGVGLTRSRAEALRGLARAVADGRLDLEGPPHDVSGGLGAPWDRRLDGAMWRCARSATATSPAADLVLRRAAASGGPPSPPRARGARRGPRPYRGYAVILLWKSSAEWRV
jgi:AraC family transcriptional regulator of adaptative response / DNA-3-methyladenine glycosylase II